MKKKSILHRYPWLLAVLLLILFGVVGRMDFMEEVRIEYQDKCPNGVIDVEGDNVTCTEQNLNPQVIGVIK